MLAISVFALRPVPAPELDLCACRGCRKNVSIYAQASEGASSEDTNDIRALDWRPGCLSSVLFYFHLLQITSAGTSNLGRLEVNFCISS